MVACLERTDRNVDLHEIVDFLTTSPIHYALTQIHATVDGKTVVISKSLMRSDLHFNDEDGITCLTNETIFENLVLMGTTTEPQPAPSTTQPIIEDQIPVIESSSPQNTQTPRQALQEDTQLPQTSVLADEAIFKEWDDRVVRATTTAASLDATHASGVNTPGSDEERIKHQELMDNILPTPHDSPLSGGYIPGSDEGRPGLHELMTICTKLSDSVLDLEKEKDAQAVEILKLKNIIKKLERKAKSSIPPPKRRLYNNKTEEFNLSDKGSGGIEVFDDTTAAEKDVNAAEPVSTVGDAVTATSVILDIDTAGPSNISIVGPSTTQIKREQRIARERAIEQKAKDAALIVEFYNVQARMEVDTLLAVRLQEEEREQFSIDEQARFLVETIAERKSYMKGSRSGLMTLFPMDSKEGGKKAKSKDAAEKEGLKAYLKIIPDEDRAVNYETFAIKYPIVH
ncbi:hypothetical protein Tco_0115499 [Tanacetum coccineum]